MIRCRLLGHDWHSRGVPPHDLFICRRCFLTLTWPQMLARWGVKS